MRKIIKRKIQISTHKRDLIDFINDEFYSHDKHNAFIEFTMKSLPTDNIIALFYFQKTKRYVETKAFVDGDKFTIEFDTSLINTDETVLGFIYLEKVAQSADVHRFSFGVKVSEIDKLHDVPIEEAKTKRVVPIEDIVTKTELDELFKRIEKNGGTYNDTEIRSSISSISERVQALENKPDNDSDVKSRLNALESNASKYLTEHQPLTRIEERIQQVEARFNNLSNIYLSSHQSLEHLATNDALGKIEQRVQKLEAIDVTNFATKQELDALRNSQPLIENRLTALENKPAVDTGQFAKKSEIPQPYNDSELRNQITQLETNSVTKEKVESVENRVQVLENKSVVTHEELESAGYLKEHQPLTDYATNSKVEAVESRVLALENKPSVVPQGYDDSGLKQRITALEAKPEVDVSEYAKKTEVPTIDSVNNLLRAQGEQATKITTLEAKSAYEIHGTGMPNGQVTAPIGTTYVDMNVTNGALKWIKRTGTGNTGWQVFTGDTGWRTLPLEQKRGTARLQIRRINDQVIVKFDGLSWGWFGVNDIEKLGGSVVEKTIGGKKYIWIKLSVGRGVYVLPEGFRSASSLLSGLYGDLGDLLGSVYVGGTADSNAIQLRYAMERNSLTSNILSQIRISPITFITDDDWPTRLP